jgi:hypothetical protein
VLVHSAGGPVNGKLCEIYGGRLVRRV